MTVQELWVFSEKPALLAELLGCARTLNPGRISALVLGPRSAAERAAAIGADRVLWLGEPGDNRIVDDYVPTLVRLVEEQSPGLILIGSTRRGRAVAARLAAHFGASALTDVLQFIQEGEGLQVRHMIFGGGAVRVDRPLAETVIATVGSGQFEPLPTASNATAELQEIPFVEPAWQVKLVERKPRPPATVDLTAARRVVCAGRGLAKKEDLTLVEELAHALNAEVACTRPLAEGLDWLPVERYIGISGAVVRPDLYLGVGVSGQAQHVIGMSRSKVVVAINKDPNAPILSQADYAITGDLYTVVPALIQAIQSHRGTG